MDDHPFGCSSHTDAHFKALQQEANTVMEVFPQLSRDHVIADLRRTGDMNTTIQNVIHGRIPDAPSKGGHHLSLNYTGYLFRE